MFTTRVKHALLAALLAGSLSHGTSCGFVPRASRGRRHRDGSRKGLKWKGYHRQQRQRGQR